ncbi:MAG: UDP-N-acetylmuramate dehydrogenase [Bacillota bacterium]|nr:UDP-N-acetylmuramate dehydrogenase [Bacillota bacterium]
MQNASELTWQTLRERYLIENKPLSPLLSIRTGGPARYFLEVQDSAVALRAWQLALEKNIPVLFLGSGSNLLLADEGFPGLVIHFGSGYADIVLKENRVFAQCGVTMKALSFFAADHGLKGLTFAAGIPGSLGGALLMNAGAYGGEMSQVVEAVACVDQNGRHLTLSREEAQLSYRHSRMMDEKLLILGATLVFEPGDKAQLYEEMAAYQTMRRDKQPLTYPSVGSFFKRPPGHFAGALIEQAGLKGLTIGGAQVSEKHAGFLINIGGATTRDFLDLKMEVQRRVMERFGVLLEPEVRIIGDEGR